MAFEAALAEYWGVTSVIGVASGTDALELSLKAVMPSGGRAVLTAANAGGYSATAARRAGFSVEFADVDAESFCLSEETVRQALSSSVGVVVVTHLYGRVTDIRGLVDFCHSRGIAVVEDWAQSLGADLPSGGRGISGDIAATSFYPTKNLGALGDGGAIATDDGVLSEKVRQLRQYGWKTKYNVELAGGTNSRLDELQAAFLMARLPKLDAFNERRREIIHAYLDSADGKRVRVLPARGLNHVGHLAVAITAERDDVRAELLSKGVMTDIHFPVPDHRQKAFYSPNVSLPVTEMQAREVFSLPCFPELTDIEVAQVCEALRSMG